MLGTKIIDALVKGVKVDMTMNTMHRTFKRIDQRARSGFVVRSRFTTKNSHRIACLINDAMKSIIAGCVI
jgi:hypothetical protein